jgi:hypothetical protein
MIARFAATGLVAALIAIGLPARAAEISGMHVDERATVADTVLVLNGAGDFAPSGKGAYVGAFYMRAKKHTLQEVQELGFWPKRITLTMLRDMPGDDLGDTLVQGIRRNTTQDETRNLGLQIARLGSILGNLKRLPRGSNLAIDWLPGRGTVFVVNGKSVDEPIPGAAFYDVMLKVWLGSQPVDANLRNAMLGVR